MGFGSKLKKIGGAIIGHPAIGPVMQIGGDYLAQQEELANQAKNRQFQGEINERNYQMQKEFAQMGIQWRAEDARAAGLHPLAAIGANVGGGAPSFQVSGDNGSPRAEFLSRTGQNISRAIAATMTREERALRMLQIEDATTDIEIKKERLRQMRQMGPGFPGSSDPYLSGQEDGTYKAKGMDPRVTDIPLRRIFMDPKNLGREYGHIADYTMGRGASGKEFLVPGQILKERIEDTVIFETQAMLRWAKDVLNGNIKTTEGHQAIPNPFTGELISMHGAIVKAKQIMNSARKHSKGLMGDLKDAWKRSKGGK